MVVNCCTLLQTVVDCCKLLYTIVYWCPLLYTIVECYPGEDAAAGARHAADGETAEDCQGLPRS